MGTRSTIALEFADGTVEQVYCHWDGYLSHNGKILQEHYSDPFKLQKLIDLGSLSVLDEEVEPTGAHCFENAQKGVCVFYGRDRGETEQGKSRFDHFLHYQNSADMQGFDYILRNDGKWYVNVDDEGFVELSEAFKKAGNL
jgi:(2Fe-2S) ferredoxin